MFSTHHTFIQAAGADIIDDVHPLIQCSLCCIRPNCIHRDYYVSYVHQFRQNRLQYLPFILGVQKSGSGSGWHGTYINKSGSFSQHFSALSRTSLSVLHPATFIKESSFMLRMPITFGRLRSINFPLQLIVTIFVIHCKNKSCPWIRKTLENNIGHSDTFKMKLAGIWAWLRPLSPLISISLCPKSFNSDTWSGQCVWSRLSFRKAFQNITVCDLSAVPLKRFWRQWKKIRLSNAIFWIEGKLRPHCWADVFCALDLNWGWLMLKNVINCWILGQNSRLTFKSHFEKHGPFGAIREEYQILFGDKFHIKEMSDAYNSIPRVLAMNCLLFSKKAYKIGSLWQIVLILRSQRNRVF